MLKPKIEKINDVLGYEISKMLSPEILTDLQNSVDEMRNVPQFRNYVNEHKLGLIDSNYDIIDRLLDLGYLI